MFNNNFDPYEALMKLQTDMSTMIRAHNHLARRVDEQAQTIDVLIQGLSASNKANEIMMRDMLKNINQTLEKVK